jgi:2-polyprenyl-6-methoxyphenol hydroxylase-like FAD-dependent oxidoreductase
LKFFKPTARLRLCDMFRSIGTVSNSIKVDVAIVGASVSGSFLAYLLGKHGVEVALIDKVEFPRHKACGEGLSSAGVRYLEKAGLWSKELEHSSIPFFGYDITSSGGDRVVLASNNKQRPDGYTISRKLLDQTLYSAAGSLPSTSTIYGCVETIQQQSGRNIIKHSNGEVDAGIVVLANGKLFNPKTWQQSTKSARRFGLVYWVSGCWKSGQPNTIIIRQHDEVQILLTPLAGGELNISVMVGSFKGASTSHSKLKLQKLAFSVAKEFGYEIDQIIDQAGSAEIVSGKSGGNRTDTAYFLIGDAAERFDPIGGMGMTHSLLSASLAGKEIVRVLRSGALKQAAIRRYEIKRKLSAVPLRLLTKLSFDLIVGRSPWVCLASRCAPALAYRIQSQLKRLVFPIGLARCISRVDALESQSHQDLALYGECYEKF